MSTKKPKTPADPNAPKRTRAPNSRRLYLVSRAPGADDTGTDPIPVALVEASSAAQAVDFHTGAHQFSAKYAEQADLFAAAKAGLEPQSAPVKAE